MVAGFFLSKRNVNNPPTKIKVMVTLITNFVCAFKRFIVDFKPSP